MCGCGNKVVTPITPTDWTYIFNGEAVSLSPSIGNWNFKCQSHYWIKHGAIIWSDQWTQDEIEKSRNKDLLKKIEHFKQFNFVSVEAGSELNAGYIRKYTIRLWTSLREMKNRAGQALAKYLILKEVEGMLPNYWTLTSIQIIDMTSP